MCSQPAMEGKGVQEYRSGLWFICLAMTSFAYGETMQKDNQGTTDSPFKDTVGGVTSVSLCLFIRH